MNVIVVSGNISQAAEIRKTGAGDSVATFSVADNQGKDKKAIFHRCSLFGKRAESLLPYLQVGQAVTVSGSLTEREYVNKDGVTVKAQDIRVQDVALQGGAKREDSALAERAPTREQARDRQHAASRPAPNFSDMDEGIPF